jgi:hypothetical protein
MKKIHYLLLALACIAMTACQDGDWDEPSFNEPPYGNNAITETGIVSIADVKADPDFASAIKNSKAKLVDKDIKIRAWVTGNDLGGNLYKQVAVQDETGALIISVNQGGICGYLPEGQEVIIDLKGLYIGAYGAQPQVGTPYNGSIGRMSKDIWATHFKIVGGLNGINTNKIEPVDFSTIMGKIDENAGKLVVLKDVQFVEADGKKTLIDGEKKGGNYYNTHVKVGNKSIIIRTSSYADFAKMTIPTGTCDITGIATRFSSDWQIMMRKTSDLVVKN